MERETVTGEVVDEVAVRAAVDRRLVEQALQGSLNLESHLHSYLKPKAKTGENNNIEEN